MNLENLLRKLTAEFAAVVRTETYEIKRKLNEIEERLNNLSTDEAEIHQPSLEYVNVQNGNTWSKKSVANDVDTGAKPKNKDTGGLPTSKSNYNNNPVAALNAQWKNVEYQVLNKRGPPHAPIFEVAVKVNGSTFSGSGSSKKDAFNQAAKRALETLDGCDEDEEVKGAVMILNESYPNIVYDCVETGNSDVKYRFRVTARVGKERFVGFGQNKKQAKNEAACEALSRLEFNNAKNRY